MDNLQYLIIWCFAAVSLSGFLYGIKNTKKNPYGLSYIYNIIGAFVWVDAVVFGAFWVLISVAVLFLNNFVFFLLTLSLFWLVRSAGEIQYWIYEQFAQSHRNPPHTLWVSKFFPHESAWIVMQIFWQCVLVMSIIFSLYFVKVLIY